MPWSINFDNPNSPNNFNNFNNNPNTPYKPNDPSNLEWPELWFLQEKSKRKLV